MKDEVFAMPSPASKPSPGGTTAVRRKVAPKTAAKAVAKQPAAAASLAAARYATFSAALRRIDTTIDETRVMNDRAAKSLA